MKKIITVFAIVITLAIFCSMLIVPSCEKEKYEGFFIAFFGALK